MILHANIIEDEQQGQYRAQYGKQVLKVLSERLTDRFGDGWSVETLDKCRKFYRVYSSSQISSTPSTELNIVNSVDEIPSFTLSWSHYLILMRIDNPDKQL